MSLKGAAQKTLFLLGLLLLGAELGSFFPHAALSARAVHPVTVWPLYHALSVPWFWPGLLATVLAVIGFIAWHLEAAQVYLVPAFALVEGMCLSSLALATNIVCPGVGLMALVATCALLLVLLGAYCLGWIRDVSPWSVGVAAVFVTAAAGLGVILFLRLLGQDIALTGHANIVYWAIACGFMVYLSQELALSFRYIEEASEMGAPKWMEWRAAFGLMVTLVWIYVVLLDVLRQVMRNTRSRN